MKATAAAVPNNLRTTTASFARCVARCDTFTVRIVIF